MLSKNRKPTKASKVLESLRQDITAGVFAPGEKLQMEQLKQHYGVGYSPLREALSRLVNNGLVEMEEQCGFSVAPLSLDELHDLYHVRTSIETEALRLSIQYGDSYWEADVLASWHYYERYIDPKFNKKFSPDQWDLLQKDFLDSLVKACRSPWLLKIREMLYQQASRYRSLCLNENYKNKKILREVLEEDKRLMQAVLARNAVKAVKISQQIWKLSVESIAKSLQDKIAGNIK